MKALPSNILANHPSYRKILNEYKIQLERDGKVNNKKFWENIILPEIPTYALQTWYSFLNRYKTATGIQEAEVISTPTSNSEMRSVATEEFKVALLSNKDATSKGIAHALNIGADRLQQIMENPQLMTAKEAMDVFFKAMKAQDSRIHAIGKVREDNREEEKLTRAFSDDAYEGNG